MTDSRFTMAAKARWAKTSPEERRAAMQKVVAGRWGRKRQRGNARPKEDRIAELRRKVEWHLAKAAEWEAKANALANRTKGVTLTGKPDQRAGGRKPERDREIAEKRATGMSLEEIGQEYRMTRERVRQIVDRYDRLHGTNINPVAKAGSHKRMGAKRRKPMQIGYCEVCGKEIKKPSGVKMARVCPGRCVQIAAGRLKMTDNIIERCIELRYEGKTWDVILREVGVGTMPNTIMRAVYSYLARQNILTPAIVETLYRGRGSKAGHKGKWNSWAKRYGTPTESGVPIRPKHPYSKKAA